MPSLSRTYEVRAIDENLDVWIVATNNRDTAEHIEKMFTKKGYKDVEIVETKNAPRS